MEITCGLKRQRRKHREVFGPKVTTDDPLSPPSFFYLILSHLPSLLALSLSHTHTLKGNADAQFSLGQYHFSQGNHETALQYFYSAETGGSMQACYQLGVMYYDGLGTPQDPVS